MKPEEFLEAVKEMEKKIGVKPRVTVDICTAMGCKRCKKGKWGRNWCNLKAMWSEIAFFNTLKNIVYINPMYVKYGSGNDVKSSLAHEFSHCKFSKSKKWRGAEKKILNKLKKWRKKMLKTWPPKDSNQIAKDICKDLKILMEFQILRFEEEEECNKIAKKMYPSSREERSKTFLKMIAYHPFSAMLFVGVIISILVITLILSRLGINAIFGLPILWLIIFPCHWALMKRLRFRK